MTADIVAEILQLLRDDPNVNHLTSHSSVFTDGDWYRMVATVKECNADFEGFCLRSLPGNPTTMVGYPVFYSDEVKRNEAFGGMWSDIVKGVPQHFAAFVHLVRRK